MDITAAAIGARIDTLEALAWRDMYKAAPPVSVQALELSHHQQAHGVGMALRKIPSPLFNRFLMPVSGSMAQESLGQAVAWIKQNAASTQAIDIQGDSSIAASLQELGFQ